MEQNHGNIYFYADYYLEREREREREILSPANPARDMASGMRTESVHTAHWHGKIEEYALRKYHNSQP
jgi:hypothetical protein